MENGIVGVWALRSFHIENQETKQRSEPFGPEPRGTLMLHPEGRMVALLTLGEPKAPVDGDGKAAGFQQIVAYAGRYRLESPDRLVTSVDVAWMPDWVGTDQARTYRLDGDRLVLFTPPNRMPHPDGGGATVIAILSFAREPATST